MIDIFDFLVILYWVLSLAFIVVVIVATGYGLIYLQEHGLKTIALAMGNGVNSTA